MKLGDNHGDREGSVRFERPCGQAPSVYCNAGERQVGGIGFPFTLSRDIDLDDIEVGEAFAIGHPLKVWACATGGTGRCRGRFPRSAGG